ncbi:MAG: ABC-2 transporter permease [Ruminococcus sp.]|jgi:ABC-type transport system involved in multi-copper enzyme maturation permease subunit|nr:ABC-2 transporter permease [Ruminococcus sp.]
MENINKIIKLDWLVLKRYRAGTIAVTAFLLVIGGAIIPLFITMFMTVCVNLLSLNTLAVSEKDKLENLYLTLPISRRDIVNAKYMFSVIVTLIATVLGVLFFVFFTIYGPKMGLPTTVVLKPTAANVFLVCSLSFFLYSGCALTFIPSFLKKGINKSGASVFVPMVLFYVVAIAVAILWEIFSAFQKFALDFIAWCLNNTVWFSISLCIISAAMFYVSYLLSIRAYTRREF